MTTSPESNSSGPSRGRRISVEDLTSDGGVRPGFGGAVGWTVLGTIIPGLGLWRAGHRIIGGIIMGLLVVVLGGLTFVSVTKPKSLTAMVTDPTVLVVAAVALLLVALGWVVVITTTHLELRPARATAVQRVTGGILVGGLAFAVAAPMAIGANLSYTSAVALSAYDEGTPVNVEDPWDGKQRINILILGGDSGTGRDIKLGIRPDSVSVASINTTNGAITLINIPRQTARMPFPKDSPLHKYFPNGFYNGDPLNQEYALNAMYRNIPATVPNNILGDTKDFGASVMMVSVGEAVGLHIDYHVIVNMDGFKDIINAIGGITVNVNDRVPIGGSNASGTKPAVAPSGWIEIGPNQHLMGNKALWYARGRYQTTDYKRMERQQCVINAVVKQANPVNILNNFQSIVAAGTKTLRTDVPRSLFPALADLALKARNNSIRNILLNHSIGFDTTNPNWPSVRKRVKRALADADAAANATATPAASPSVTSEPSSSSTQTASPSPTATKTKKSTSNLDDACAYHPNK
jgi:polyisoprenyl-teichoic acid--peptidoglycan teichoic acid transferase